MTPATLLPRQIHPAFVTLGLLTSQAIYPTPKDQQKLAVYDGDLINAASAWSHYRSRHLESAGALAGTVAGCASEQLEVGSSPEIFAEHAKLDFPRQVPGLVVSARINRQPASAKP